MPHDDAGALRSARLMLVPCTPAVARAALAGGAALRDLLGAAPGAGWPGPNFADYLTVLVADAERGRWAWLIVLPAERAIIGDIGFHGPPDSSGTVELGYVLTPAYRGRGYATEAARAVLAWAADQATVRRITATCDADNRASINVLEKLGLRPRGREGSELHWEWVVP